MQDYKTHSCDNDDDDDDDDICGKLWNMEW